MACLEETKCYNLFFCKKTPEEPVKGTLGVSSTHGGRNKVHFQAFYDLVLAEFKASTLFETTLNSRVIVFKRSFSDLEKFFGIFKIELNLLFYRSDKTPQSVAC